MGALTVMLLDPMRYLAAFLMLAAAPMGAAPPFNPEQLAEGVYLFRPVSDEPGRTNSLVVERRRDLLVVEAQPSPKAARELLDAIGRLSPKPIRFLVLSHPHAEVAGGTSAFPDSVLVITSEEYALAMQDLEHDFGAETRARAADPAGWRTPVPRPPDLIVPGVLILEDPANPVRITHTGHAHCRGELTVMLPNSQLLYLGAMLFSDRNPYAKNGNVSRWIGLLNHISRNPSELLVPLHGPPTDIMALRRNRDAFAWLRGQLEFGFIEGLTAEEIPHWFMERPDLEKYFDISAEPSYLKDLVDQALAELVAQRAKRGR